MIKLSSKGTVFFVQRRVGKDARLFPMIKFRTMTANHGGNTISVRGESRITPIGAFLRKYKLDELPELLNVLIGDMSFVGARPLIPGSYMKYSEPVREHIYDTPPGITGIGSIIFRDEERLVTEVKKQGMEPLDYYREHIYPYKGTVEMWYQDNISFWTDLKILFITFWQILFPQSNLVYRVFPDLPPRPKDLTVEGIRKIRG